MTTAAASDGTNKKLEHDRRSMCRRRLRAHRAPGRRARGFSWNDRSRKRRSGRQRRAYGVPLGRVRQPNRAPLARQCGEVCTLSRTGIARSAPVRNIGGGGHRAGTGCAHQGDHDDAAGRMACGRGRIGDALALRYVAILALIPALARLVGGWLIGGYTPFLAALIGARRRLCAELRDGLRGGAGGRSPGAEIRRRSAAIRVRCA